MNDKSKDTAKARQDLKSLGIRSGLWLGQNKNGKCSKPQAAYSFTPEDRKKFCQFIKGVKLPDDTNITGLKSHDCHIMMQRLLPYGLQQYLPPDVAKPLIELCLFFKQICSQTLMVDDMLKAQSKVIDILCNLELIYPPAFFDIMIHLVIHLPLEAIFGGPIRPRWMYPFERYMKKLKNYVRNKAKPEGSIAEGYVAEEALNFSSHYFRDVTTKFNRPGRNVDCPPPTCQFQVFKSLCKSIGLRSVIRIDHQELKKVIWYVLHNSPEIDTYRAKFKIRDERRTTQNSGICSPGPDGEMYYGQLEQILEFSYLSFKTVLFRVKLVHTSKRKYQNCVLENQLTQIKATMSADVARGHGGDGGGDDRPLNIRVPTGLWGCLGEPRVAPRPESRFEVNDRETLMPLGDHAAHWANYLGELVRELPLHYPSWRQMSPERKAGVVAKIGVFRCLSIADRSDLRTHMWESGRWPQIYAAIQPMHLQKKITMARRLLSKKDIGFLKRTGLMTWSASDADDEMLRLQGLGSNTPTGVPYTEDEIMAIVRGGKQRGHIPGVGRVLPGQGTVIPPPSQSTHSTDIARLKKREKQLTKQVNMFMRLFRSDDKFSQMLNQFESQPEYGGGSGSGGCGDDEPGDDEDGGEDEDDS
ncbi:hypothetical protein Tco_0678273 [Tanacetum coccineum]|uniref:DUF4218 domain-containing protein n=1 Tax=Tanacetum coccineum TaxID=301880 RepID=A0ABQ4XEJ5_9ASTR